MQIFQIAKRSVCTKRN